MEAEEQVACRMSLRADRRECSRYRKGPVRMERKKERLEVRPPLTFGSSRETNQRKQEGE